MKWKRIILMGVFLFLIGNAKVYAANSFVITAPTSANVNSTYTVSISHSGTTIGSLQMSVAITNAECSVQSTCSGGVSNCSGGTCLTSFNLANGLKAGEKIITLSCRSTGGTAKFVASVANKDAWDVEGMTLLTIASATKSVTINGTTSTTKSTTTTTTTTRRPTTARSTTTKNGTTTSKATTSKGTTSKVVTTAKSSTTTSTKSTTTSFDTMTSEITTDDIFTEEVSTELTTMTTTVYIPDDLKLNTLKIVGYNINFKPNLTSYTIDVEENVDELYIIASPADEQTEIENIGLVDIAGKDYILIRVFNENARHEINYKINIRRTGQNEGNIFTGNFLSDGFKLVTFAMMGVIFILIIFFTIASALKKRENKDNKENNKMEILDGAREVEEKVYEHKEEHDRQDLQEIIEADEFIPSTEEELQKLFEELDKEHRK